MACLIGTGFAGGALGMNEFHAPPRDTMPLTVVVDAPSEFVAGGRVELSARVADTAVPDSVVLSVRRRDQRFFRHYAMRPSGAYDYAVSVAADSIGVGPFEYAITVVSRGAATTFPEGAHQRPGEWNFVARELWQGAVVDPSTPLALFRAGEDVEHLAFSRIGDGWREGIFRVVQSASDGEPVFHFELPRFNGQGPDDYTASLVVGERIAARGAGVRQAAAVQIRLRGGAVGDVVHLTLVEHDGSSWSAEVPADTAWSEREIPLARFKAARSAMLPEGFPGEWNYWVSAPPGRGGAGDAVRAGEIERVQLSLRASSSQVPRVDVEWVKLAFSRGK